MRFRASEAILFAISRLFGLPLTHMWRATVPDVPLELGSMTNFTNPKLILSPRRASMLKLFFYTDLATVRRSVPCARSNHFSEASLRNCCEITHPHFVCMHAASGI